jgi:hypothetical protein
MSQGFNRQMVFAAGEVVVEGTFWGGASLQDFLKSGSVESLRTKELSSGFEKAGASVSCFGRRFSHRVRFS